MAIHSSKQSTTVAGLGQPFRWTDSEKRIWVVCLFFGAVLLYAARGALPITVVEMSEEFNWDKRMNVRTQSIKITENIIILFCCCMCVYVIKMVLFGCFIFMYMYVRIILDGCVLETYIAI